MFWVFLGRGLLAVALIAAISATVMVVKGRTSKEDFQAWAAIWGGAALMVFLFLTFTLSG